MLRSRPVDGALRCIRYPVVVRCRSPSFVCPQRPSLSVSRGLTYRRLRRASAASPHTSLAAWQHPAGTHLRCFQNAAASRRRRCPHPCRGRLLRQLPRSHRHHQRGSAPPCPRRPRTSLGSGCGCGPQECFHHHDARPPALRQRDPHQHHRSLRAFHSAFISSSGCGAGCCFGGMERRRVR